MNLIAFLLEINILLDFSKAMGLLELKEARERLKLELLLLELLLGHANVELSNFVHQPLVGRSWVDAWVGICGGGEGKGSTGDDAAAGEPGGGAGGWGRGGAEKTQTLLGGKLGKGSWHHKVSQW